MNSEKCIWCGITTKTINGPTHRYLESSAGCWQKYGELLTKEYENSLYRSIHELTVDAYALQHPGKEMSQTINSANIHLTSLYGYFMKGVSLNKLHEIKKHATKHKRDFRWLVPPKSMIEITVEDVLKANSLQEYIESVKKWAEYIFNKWREHHKTVEKYFYDSNGHSLTKLKRHNENYR